MIKRTALPLPRYVRRKPSKKGWTYHFDLPTWARKRADCPVKNEMLGRDYAQMVQRAETRLLPAFDAWVSGNSAPADDTIITGTLDWMFGEYRADRRYKQLSPKQRRNHERGFEMVGGYVLKDGQRLGKLPLAAITTAIVDLIYEKLLVVAEVDADGNAIERERRTTANHAMKSCRRAWNIVFRLHPGIVPHVNPFAAMGLESSSKETPTANYEELRAFRTTAKDMELPSLATAALIAWEWLQRETDIFGTLNVQHYRPKDHPDAVRVVHEKTGEENWIPLFDPETGAALYPELMGELDAIKRERIGGLMIRRDWGDMEPWPTWPKPNEEPDLLDLTHMSRKVKQVIRKAGLRDELSFRSFRHGGFTEAGDAKLTDREIMAQGRHKSAKVLGKYVKRTMEQVAEGARKRRGTRSPKASSSSANGDGA
jgi:hypothetical protein